MTESASQKTIKAARAALSKDTGSGVADVIVHGGSNYMYSHWSLQVLRMRPDLAGEVEAGVMSLNQAAEKCGIKKPRQRETKNVSRTLSRAREASGQVVEMLRQPEFQVSFVDLRAAAEKLHGILTKE